MAAKMLDPTVTSEPSTSALSDNAEPPCKTAPAIEGKQQCGDWTIMAAKASFNKTLSSLCNMTEESLRQPLTQLPQLPIDFDDEKSVDNFLEKNTPLIKVLLHVRKPIAGYQESRGVMNQNASLTFSALMNAFYLNTSAALCTVAMLLYNLTPLLDVALFVVRFIIDKTIEIVDTDDNYEFYLKAGIFLAEVLFISLLVVILSSIIVVPIVHLASHILYRAIHIIT